MASLTCISLSLYPAALGPLAVSDPSFDSFLPFILQSFQSLINRPQSLKGEVYLSLYPSPGSPKVLIMVLQRHLKIDQKIDPHFRPPKSSQSHPKVRIVEDLAPKMTAKSEPGGYPGELPKPTLYKNLQNSNPTLIYHTSAMSATPQKHQFWSLEATQNR